MCVHDGLALLLRHALADLSASPCCAWGSMAASRAMSARTKASCRSKGMAAKGGTCRKTQACMHVCVRCYES